MSSFDPPVDRYCWGDSRQRASGVTELRLPECVIPKTEPWQSKTKAEPHKTATRHPHSKEREGSVYENEEQARIEGLPFEWGLLSQQALSQVCFKNNGPNHKDHLEIVGRGNERLAGPAGSWPISGFRPTSRRPTRKIRTMALTNSQLRPILPTKSHLRPLSRRKCRFKAVLAR
ncbi:hypothetical protein GE21DRAFT_1343448 [Neurospora crassa]|nr:hypothetical protein GE21DRAFT_1343448 [Neurospora crassa]